MNIMSWCWRGGHRWTLRKIGRPSSLPCSIAIHSFPHSAFSFSLSTHFWHRYVISIDSTFSRMRRSTHLKLIRTRHDINELHHQSWMLRHDEDCHDTKLHHNTSCQFYSKPRLDESKSTSSLRRYFYFSFIRCRETIALRRGTKNWIQECEKRKHKHDSLVALVFEKLRDLSQM